MLPRFEREVAEFGPWILWQSQSRSRAISPKFVAHATKRRPYPLILGQHMQSLYYLAWDRPQNETPISPAMCRLLLRFFPFFSPVNGFTTNDGSPWRSSGLFISFCRLMTRASRALWDCRNSVNWCAIELRKFCICKNYASMDICPGGFPWVLSAWADDIGSLFWAIEWLFLAKK